MRDIVVTETFEDIDKDKDGKITVEEYIGSFNHNEHFKFFLNSGCRYLLACCLIVLQFQIKGEGKM